MTKDKMKSKLLEFYRTDMVIYYKRSQKIRKYKEQKRDISELEYECESAFNRSSQTFYITIQFFGEEIREQLKAINEELASLYS